MFLLTYLRHVVTHLSYGARNADDGDEERRRALRHAVGDGTCRTVDVRHVVADVQHHRVNTEVVEHNTAEHAQVHRTIATTCRRHALSYC